MRPSNTKSTPKPVAEAPKPATTAVNKPGRSTDAHPAHPPVRASFTSEKDGGAILKLEYAGGLAQYDPIWVRMGERRAGRDWVNTRDVKLEKVGSTASTKIIFSPGEPLEGASFAFHAKKGDEELWDNAGRSMGCYVVDAKTGAVSAH